MELNLKIDPEFQSKIPPLTEAEFKQLEENILSDGEVREPIITWNGIIVDGHNRYKIIQAHPELPWKTKEMKFADKWAAFDWMYKNQLGRRNLTDEQKRYLLGKLYEARKHTHRGNPEKNRNEDGTFQMAEKRPNGRNTDGVSKIIAEEQHVGKTQVKDAYQYSKGIDAIQAIDPELAGSILNAKTKIQKSVIQDIGKAKAGERAEAVADLKDAIEHKVTRPRKKEANNDWHKTREEMREIRGIANMMLDDNATMDYSIDNLTEQIECNASSFFKHSEQSAM